MSSLSRSEFTQPFVAMFFLSKSSLAMHLPGNGFVCFSEKINLFSIKKRFVKNFSWEDDNLGLSGSKILHNFSKSKGNSFLYLPVNPLR